MKITKVKELGLSYDVYIRNDVLYIVGQGLNDA